jgi:hypothetical protein
MDVRLRAWGLGASLVALGTSAYVAFAQLTPVPTPAPGVTHVVGDVNIANTPTVRADQAGTWTVTCVPPITTSTSFLTPALTYAFRWGDGSRETVTVLNVRPDGWVQVGGSRWVNPSMATSIERVQ